MSVLWTLVACFLYLEIAIIFLFLLTLRKPQYWRTFFGWRITKFLGEQSTLILYALIVILVLFFAESIREFHKYGTKIHTNTNKGYYEDQMRLFRSQRNFYISGFSLFSLFIIKRLAGLLARDVTTQSHQD
ncbi:PREDICTED: B-cell receptor-associated protein 31-like [Rhagoletis zephyria]|uniref:B-cell receptor-associated protein 31-like n=1 Tax=Rhagoletis zephyria TaxID=28612 RepID=UPI0008113B85|nr:PREDICTED: B-cell receptor-associated protein 31-like [Rhagoletis zephyria]